MHASSVLHPHKNGLFFAIGEESRILLSVFYTPAAKRFYQTADRHPPHMTGHRANTVSLYRGHRSPSRAPLIHDAMVVLVDQCLSRSRNLSVSNETHRQLFSGRFVAPTSAQNICFRFDLYQGSFDFLCYDWCSYRPVH